MLEYFFQKLEASNFSFLARFLDEDAGVWKGGKRKYD